MESFEAHAARDTDFGSERLWFPHVRNDERAAFEAEMTGTYQAYFNDTSTTWSL